ncbi:MAG: pilus assembly protein PilM [Candidatus Pacebacteria bacterium]|nr:pilus assembly protein PilM [Candidatus Paceibacterota bacterium]
MNLLTRLLPTPDLIAIPTVGLDFSDATMRFISLDIKKHGLLPNKFVEMEIPEGSMKGGKIIDAEKFISFLKSIKKEHNLKYARVSIPESQVYSVTLSLDISSANDIRGAIELVIEDNIPLKALETVFDYHILNTTDKNIVVQVVALPESVSENYFNAFSSAGIIPVSFELEGQAITRAVLDPEDNGATMIVDFGANRTGITIVTNKTAIVTATLDFGGKMLTEKLAKELNMSLEEAEKIKRAHGLTTIGEHKDVFSILVSGISALKDEINRRYLYWHEKRKQFEGFPAIDTIYLCGGHSNLAGLDDYLSSSLKLKVVKVDPWRNCFSVDEYIPEMHRETSMSYVTAIGLALADFIYD